MDTCARVHAEEAGPLEEEGGLAGGRDEEDGAALNQLFGTGGDDDAEGSAS